MVGLHRKRMKQGNQSYNLITPGSKQLDKNYKYSFITIGFVQIHQYVSEKDI